MQMLFNKLFHPNRISSIDREAYLAAEQQLLEEYSAGEVAQLLQFFHSAGKRPLPTISLHALTDFVRFVGVLIGFGLRNGLAPILSLPPALYALLANEHQQPSAASFTSAHQIYDYYLHQVPPSATTAPGALDPPPIDGCRSEYAVMGDCRMLSSIGLVMRFGICSIYPETLLDLYSFEEMKQLFSGYPSPSPHLTCVSVSQLFHRVQYDLAVNPNDLYIHVSYLCPPISASVELITFPLFFFFK